MNPSETVQAAQRLQISGTLVAMGGEVPRLEIECDNGEIVTVANLPATLLYEMPMLLYKRVRLTVEAESQPEPAAAPEDAERRFGPVTSDPADAERNTRAKEDAERAAYFERWKDAPEWAQWLSQDPDGRCDFFESMPAQDERGVWMLPNDIDFYSGSERVAGQDLLGSARCEPRPVQGVGP